MIQPPVIRMTTNTAMIFGIVGLVALPTTCIGSLLGIVAIVLGGKARREIDASPGYWSGRSQATAGWVMGIISIVLAAIWIVYLVVVIVIAASSTT